MIRSTFRIFGNDSRIWQGRPLHPAASQAASSVVQIGFPFTTKQAVVPGHGGRFGPQGAPESDSAVTIGPVGFDSCPILTPGMFGARTRRHPPAGASGCYAERCTEAGRAWSGACAAFSSSEPLPMPPPTDT